MRELLLVRYGEIFLKGLNRPYFMKALVKKIRYAVKDLGGQVWLHDGRIFVSDFSDLESCIDRVRRVFGVHSVCPAVEMPKEDFEAIAVVCDTKRPGSPCGSCRQVISELMPEDVRIVLGNLRKDIKVSSIDELLPYAFSEEDL